MTFITFTLETINKQIRLPITPNQTSRNAYPNGLNSILKTSPYEFNAALLALYALPYGNIPIAEEILLIIMIVPFVAMRRWMNDCVIDITPKRLVSNMLLMEEREASIAGIVYAIQLCGER